MESLGLALEGPLDREREEVRLAKARDPVVWGAWYDRYQPLVYRYAYARLGSKEEAEDVASSTFLKALQAIDRYQYRGRPVLAWLYRIARNAVSDRFRRRRPELQLHDTGANLLINGPEDSVASIDLRQAMASLTDAQREVLALRYFVALTPREVAALVGKSEAAVHSLQVRGLEALRRRLSR